MQAKGTLGLIATNTVAQGDTREVGLDAIVAAGFTITRAIQSRSWPASSANLEYAAVWGTLDAVADDTPRMADDAIVQRISTLLEPSGRVDGNPIPLRENAGMSFIGCYVLGMGFVIASTEAQEWIAADARNAEVLFPYLNGEDLNSRPDASASRWVIDFNDWSEATASEYALPYARLEEKVKPERQRLKDDGSYVLRRPLPERWWQFGEKRPALRRAIAGLPEVLVIARVSKTVMPLRVPTAQVFHEKVVVFASDSHADQAVLSSSVHQLWAIKYGTTMRTDPTYTPDLVFGSLPRPMASEPLYAAGRQLDEFRRDVMIRRNLGVTKLYNMINDSGMRGDADIDRLRDIHIEVDRATVDAYGWHDLRLQHGFHRYRQMERWSVDAQGRVEILDRLLAENQVRAQGQPDQIVPPDVSASPNVEGTLFG